MTVTAAVNKWGPYAGNGATVAFAAGKIFDDDDLIVYLIQDSSGDATLQVKTTNYTVAGMLTNSVTVTFLVAPPSGYSVLIYRSIAQTQTTDFKNAGEFLPQSHEDRIDRLTMMVLSLQEQLNRSLHLPVTDISGVSVELPESEPGMILGWNTATGDIDNVAMDLAVVAAATTTTPGISELSTDAEAVAKSGNTVVTAGNLAALNSSETFGGFAERASTSEANAGTDDVRYMTSLKTRASLGPSILAATAKSTPVGADILGILDSAASNVLKRSTIAQTITAMSLFSSINIQSFTGNGTYTPTSGMKYCITLSTGGGAGGGGADTDGGASNVGVGAGGGAGATCIEYFTAAQIGASQTVAIGAAGTAGSATNGATGGNGGDTTFGALHTAGGGVGGAGSGVSAASFPDLIGSAGGAATGGTVNIPGGQGGAAFGFSVDGTSDAVCGLGGHGGGSFWGGGGSGAASASASLTTDLDVAGIAATVYGAGGGGAVSLTSTTGAAGGAGMTGLCVVIEFI